MVPYEADAPGGDKEVFIQAFWFMFIQRKKENKEVHQQ